MNTSNQPSFSTYFRVLNFIGEVISNDKEFISEFRYLYYKENEPVSNPHASYKVYIDRHLGLNKIHSITGPRKDEFLLITAFYPSILPALEQSINKLVIQKLDTYCLVESGFITYDGLGLLIVGGYETGRNLLIKTLVERGCIYYGDAISILDMPRYEAIHFPKSIAVESLSNKFTKFRGRNPAFRERNRTSSYYVLPAERAKTIKACHRIDFVFFPKKASGSPALTYVTPADALMRLMESTFDRRQNSEKQFDYLAGLVRKVQSFCISIKGLKKTTDLIFQQLRAD